MKTAQTGDQVTVVYEGMLASGEIFESSKDTGPLSFTIGDNTVMPAFEAAVLGMKAGEDKAIKVAPKNGYGERNEELVHTVLRSAINAQAELGPGMVIGMNMERDGKTHQVPAMVTKIDGDRVTVDFNHPLAGQELIYKITVQSVTSPEGPGDCLCSAESGCDC